MVHQNLSAERIIELSRQHGFMAQRLYVIRTEPSGGAELISASLAAHLKYWVDLEKKNVLFAGGPLLSTDDDGDSDGSGMVIFRAASITEAMRTATQDPMYLSGARCFTVIPWLLNHLNPHDLISEVTDRSQ